MSYFKVKARGLHIKENFILRSLVYDYEHGL